MNSDTLSKFKSLQQSLTKERETLVARLAAIEAVLGSSTSTVAKAGLRKGEMSAAGRARIVAAQKARWAKIKKAQAGSSEKLAPKKKSGMSAAARARIAAAVKARWAKVKASGQATLKKK